MCVFVLPCVGYFHLSGIILCQQQDMRMFACMLSMGSACLSTYLVKCVLRFCALYTIYRKLYMSEWVELGLVFGIRNHRISVEFWYISVTTFWLYNPIMILIISSQIDIMNLLGGFHGEPGIGNSMPGSRCERIDLSLQALRCDVWIFGNVFRQLVSTVHSA